MSLITDYPLRDIPDVEIHEKIPRQYWVAFAKLDKPEQCFLINNPDRCGEVEELAYADRRMRVVGVVRAARAENCTWSKTREMVKSMLGLELSEKTLRKWAGQGWAGQGGEEDVS